ncbi:aspartate aminotransferase family protein [Marinospirillum alkaliphilum]|uniref:Acetylornithine aminotransferase n=1 Tax=Marinospirillum alkaliphilum DSM 21637 TaxID=1122209 RepID=A0A1K1UDX8_9GAMM|nr:aspartate aminotransferase family protein [Marinospirillum alkaliphilum]SFX11070.1 acetylornithine aminotransferase [Marinospirillum alkaliphilum DSM 21637]
MAETALMHTYGRLPIAFAEGKGSRLTDTEGKHYLDALCGIAVCGLGHAHPAVTRAISEQAARLVHTSNLYRIPLQEAAGQKLAELSGMEKIFFCNSGAEANEGAIKLARLHGHKKGIEVPHVLVMENAFHGRTLATLTATGNRKVQAGFEPLVTGFIRCAYNDLDAVRNILERRQDVAAILVEPVQGEGGLRAASDEVMNGLRQLCDQYGLLLMLDEVQTGNGRTGTYYAFQRFDWKPDVVTTAKGLGNGFPIGAVMAQGAAAELFQPGHHGSTYGGTPLGCAVVLAVLETLEKEGLCQRAQQLGERIMSGLNQQLTGLAGVLDIRGRGLMIGIELDQPCGELVQQALDAGLLINVTAGQVVRLLPPLTFTDQEADQLVEQLSQLIKNWLATRSPS